MKSYFSHDSNARNDDKILKLRMKHGAEGYGIYFMLLEKMREEDDSMLKVSYLALSFELRIDENVLKEVVEDFDLFEFTEKEGQKFFYSKSFLERMDLMNQKSLARQRAGSKGAEKRWQSYSNANSKNSNAINSYSNANGKNSNAINSYSNANGKNSNAIFANGNKTKLNKTKLNQNNKEGDTRVHASAPAREPKHKHGEYKNVLLTDEQFENLTVEFPGDYQERIERLSEYIECKGVSYKNHYATIKAWARKDELDKVKSKPIKGVINTREYDFDDLEKQLLGG